LNSIFDFSSAKIYVKFLMSRCPSFIWSHSSLWS